MVSGGALGFALGGFFDGILLHQILQWHHLLSLVEGIGGLRAQVLWDGAFHAAMYVVAAVGLWGLWRAYRSGRPVARERLGAALLAGFGAWHVIDAVFSHWLFGIHRVRLDVASPLAWDIGWLVVFGLVPIALGIALNRGGGGGGGVPGRRSLAGLALLALLAGGWAARGPATEFSTVVFRPGMDLAGTVAALDAVGARMVDGWPGQGVLVVDVDPSARWALYRHGALYVSGTGPAGCLDWSRL